jgi:hypothetical protein
VQPVVDLTANGASRAEVAPGERVTFDALVEVPPGAGTIVAAEWDFEGTAEYPLVEPDVDGSANRLALRATHAFAAPGTYFPALRVTINARATRRRGTRGSRTSGACASSSSACALPVATA